MVNVSRAVIQIDNNFIFIKREKKINNIKKEYYVFVGGHLDEDENFEDACIREVYEELGINVEIDRLFYEGYNEIVDKYEKFYIVKYISGEIGSGKGVEFTNIDEDKYGKYEIVYIDKYKLKDYNILPVVVKNKLIEEMN